MDCASTTFSGHALQRMFVRGIRTDDVIAVLGDFELVAEYPDDQPYPSRLILGWIGTMPLHVVVSQNVQDYACYVITAYVPDIGRWQADFKTRRPS